MLPGAVVKAFEAAIRSTTARTGSSASPPAASYAAAVSQPDLAALAGSEEWTGGPVLADPAVWTLPAGGRTPVTAGPPRRPELCLRRCVDVPMESSIAATERAWDARVAHLLTKLPVWLRSGALVRKSEDGRGAAPVAAVHAVRRETGTPSPVIRLSTAQATRASVFWAGRVRARRPPPMMAL